MVNKNGRMLRQFNQNQKAGKSLASLKLNTKGSLIPQKKCLMDKIQVLIQGRFYDVRFVTSNHQKEAIK